MQSQTLIQTLTILISDSGDSAATGSGTLAATGLNITLFMAVALILVLASILMFRFSTRHKLFALGGGKRVRSIRDSFFVIAFLSLGALGLALITPITKAAPILSISSTDAHLTLTVPKGGSTTTISTTLTASTVNATGYTLTASLPAEEPGISLGLKGGAVTDNTALTVGATPLTLATTSQATDPTTPDTTNLTLTVTVDNTVTEGTKELKLTYAIIDNDPAEPETPPVPTTMQSMTSGYCQNHMQVYTAQDDEDKILHLTDSRGGITQTYEVAKLADNNCWMLNNLKLGSTSDSITLTSADSDVASDFILPQLNADGAEGYDYPYAYGPVPGDTGSEATNYGYLYNFSAATAGETRTSLAAGHAPHSICPAGWGLPISGVDGAESTGDFPDLDRAFGGTGQSVWSGEPNIAKWQYTGPFKVVYSGAYSSYWLGGFDIGVGSYGGLWSASAHPNSLDGAFGMSFGVDGVSFNVSFFREFGFGVRCLLQ